MAKFGKPELLEFLRSQKLAVVATRSAAGAPQAALVGVAVTDDFEVVFDTISTSRKHANLTADPRAALTWSGPGEQTVQLEGLARPVPARGAEGQAYRDAYYRIWPDGMDRLSYPDLAYWRVVARWARYADYDHGPLIVEFDWPG